MCPFISRSKMEPFRVLQILTRLIFRKTTEHGKATGNYSHKKGAVRTMIGSAHGANHNTPFERIILHNWKCLSIAIVMWQSAVRAAYRAHNILTDDNTFLFPTGTGSGHAFQGFHLCCFCSAS
jgi:hypothetical protein